MVPTWGIWGIMSTMTYKKADDQTPAPVADSRVVRDLVQHLDEHVGTDELEIGAPVSPSSADVEIINQGALAMESAKQVSRRLTSSLR